VLIHWIFGLIDVSEIQLMDGLNTCIVAGRWAVAWAYVEIVMGVMKDQNERRAPKLRLHDEGCASACQCAAAFQVHGTNNRNLNNIQACSP
jgi:hypothetical protein